MKFVDAVYYTADWCQPCKQFKPLVTEALSDKGIRLYFVDADSEIEMMGMHNVMSLPTVIFYGFEFSDDGQDSGTQEIGRIVGASKKQLTETLDNLHKKGYNGQLA